MKVYFECFPCMVNQALLTARQLELSDEETQHIVDTMLRILLRRGRAVTPQEIITALYDHIMDAFPEHGEHIDPFRKIKKETNRLALSHFDHLESLAARSDNPLETALKISAAGNIIDFSIMDRKSIDIPAEIAAIPALEFTRYDIQPLLQKMAPARSLLLIGDNAGEILFDRVLCRTLKRLYPDLHITCAVRHRPIINDATLQDARMCGLDLDVAVISSGSIYPGTILEKTSPTFQDLFETADVVLSKGQGNFETLFDMHKENLFFIFRVKCGRVANEVGEETGSVMCMRCLG